MGLSHEPQDEPDANEVAALAESDVILDEVPHGVRDEVREVRFLLLGAASNPGNGLDEMKVRMLERVQPPALEA